jgi:hypothetical protein
VGLATAVRLGGGQKSVGGGGAILVMDGVSSDLYRSVLARTRLGVESEQHKQAHSTSCAAAMA